MKRWSPLSLVLMVVLVACQTAPAPALLVYGEPEQLLGKEAQVCGYLAGPANITERRGDLRRGLSVIATEAQAPRLLKREGERVCLVGLVQYVGCATDPQVVCTDWAYDYAIKVREVR